MLTGAPTHTLQELILPHQVCLYWPLFQSNESVRNSIVEVQIGGAIVLRAYLPSLSSTRTETIGTDPKKNLYRHTRQFEPGSNRHRPAGPGVWMDALPVAPSSR